MDEAQQLVRDLIRADELDDEEGEAEFGDRLKELRGDGEGWDAIFIEPCTNPCGLKAAFDANEEGYDLKKAFGLDVMDWPLKRARWTCLTEIPRKSLRPLSELADDIRQKCFFFRNP